MTPEQKAAFIQAQVVNAYAEIESMKAANWERKDREQWVLYGEPDFMAIQDKYGLSHNAVISFFQE